MKPTRKLSKTDVTTFLRLAGFAKPYWPRLVIGAVCSAIGGGSIVALILSAQHILGFIFDSRSMLQGDEDAIVEVQEAEVRSPESEVASPKSQVPSPESGVRSPLPGEGSPPEAAEQAPSPPAADSATSVPAAETRAQKAASKLVGKFISEKDMKVLEKAGLPRLVALCGLLLLLVIVNSIAGFIGTYNLQWVGQRVIMDLRIRFFAHLQKLSVAFYNNSRTGDMISRTVADTQLLQHAVTNVITDAVKQPVTLLMMLGLIVCVEWKLALFTVVLVPLCAVPIITIGRRVRRIAREGQRRLADLTSVMQESLSGVMVVKAYGQEAREERRFTGQCREFFRRMMSATKARALSDPINYVIGCLGGIGVLLFTVVNRLPFEQCVAFAAAIWALYEPIKKISRISMDIQQSSAAADRVFEILDEPVRITDRPDAKPLSEPLRELVFDHVRFGYGDAAQDQVFRDLDLRIPAGQSLALVGPSGCGKTTLVSLLLRFFDVTGGAIRYNDTDIRNCTVASLRSQIGLVLQETFLFADTIAANIAYGRPDATRAEIEDAARRANAHDFIAALPDGYDTMLGERGVGLSGGQRQRLAIARAILRNPPILILDEATSALDTESERLVQADIDKLMGHHTVIVIAHRLSTIAKCERIAVLGAGGVMEYGTRDELLARGGMFKRLSALQSVQTEAAAR